MALAVACAAPSPSEALLRAERLERKGRVNEAAAAYDEARQEAKTPRRRAEIALRRAELLESAGRDDDAARAYLEIERAWAGSPEAARALDHVARLLHARGGDAGRAEALAVDLRILTSHPDETAADDALARIVRAHFGRDHELGVALADLHARLAGRGVDDNVLIEAAEASRRLGDAETALRLWAELADAYPRSGLRDDALWRAAELRRVRGEFREALEAWRKILATRRDALIVGSYHSEYLDDAQLQTALVWLDDLGNVARARAALLALRDDMPWSLLRDDAQFHLARASARAGDRARACGEIALLARRFPDGNQLRRAGALSKELGCR
ncbi:MAG: tetratricopeptide repeat protein [Myxococcota bacterium]